MENEKEKRNAERKKAQKKAQKQRIKVTFHMHIGSLLNGRNFLRIFGEQGRTRNASRPRRDSRFALALLSPLLARNTQKITSVLQAIMIIT